MCINLLGAPDLIDWSEEEISSIFERLVEWWDSDKNELLRKESVHFFGGGRSEFEARFLVLKDVLCRMVIPREFPARSKVTVEVVQRLVLEYRSFGLPYLQFKWAILPLLNNSSASLVEETIEASISSNESDVIECVRVCGLILDNLERYKAEIVYSVFEVIAQRIRWRQDPQLSSVIRVFSRFVRVSSSLVIEALEKSILIGLGRIATEFQLNSGVDVESDPLSIKLEAARLSFLLYCDYVNKNKPVPKEILLWRDLCASNDEFVEIRNQWPCKIDG